MTEKLQEWLNRNRLCFVPDQFKRLKDDTRKLWQSETKGALTTEMMLRDIKARVLQVSAEGFPLVVYEVATDGFVVSGKVVYETVILVRALGEVGSRNWFYHWGCELALPTAQELNLKVIGSKDRMVKGKKHDPKKHRQNRGMAEPEARIPLEARMSKVATDLLFKGIVKHAIPGFAGLQIGIDVNPSPAFRSNKVEGECKAYCAEYETILKPSPAIAAADRANKADRVRDRFTTKHIAKIETWMKWKLTRRDIRFNRCEDQPVITVAM